MNKIAIDFRIPRIKSVDFIRGLTVVDLIVFHFANILVIRSSLEPVFIIHFWGIAGAPIFLLLVGMSIVLSKNIRKQRGEAENKIKTHTIKRGLIIIILHYVLGASIFGFEAIWGWGILSLIGASIIISYWLSDCSDRTLWILAIAVIAISPFLRVLLNYQIDTAYQFNFFSIIPIETYASPWNISAFIRGVLVVPGFPIFPHIGFVIIGVWLGNVLIRSLKNNEVNKLMKKLTIAACIFIGIGIFMEILSNLFPLTPADKMVGNTGYNLWAIGVAFLFFVLFYWLQDIKNMDNKVFRFISFFGDISLTVLFVHSFVVWYLLPILGGPFNITLFSDLIITFSFTCTFWILGDLWKKTRYKYSIKWLIGSLS